MTETLPPIALIVGLCSHGLAMARALAKAGIEVHAFEANPMLPGVATNCAKVHFIRNIKSASLVDDLICFRQNFDNDREIVLFPTNDNNVKIIAQHIDTLKPHFLLTWWHCSEQVLSLLLKSNIEARCKDVGLNYPQSFVVNSKSDIEQVVRQFEFPVIAKPVNPQSGFKAIKCDDVVALSNLLDTFASDLPILVQHWISGSDKALYFGALYLDGGNVEAEFVGKKLESFPPAMGQTTIAINAKNDEVLTITKSFFEGLKMSGPVSLEVKKDLQGRFWIIEPTIGRTDFWAGLCVEAGCNLLLAEYQHAIGATIPDFSNTKSVIWFDSERDITAFPRYFRMVAPLIGKGYTASFSYMKGYDIKPFKVAAIQAVKRIGRKVFNTSRRSSSQSINSNHSCFTVDKVSELSEDFKELLSSHSDHGLFNNYSWYDIFCSQVAEQTGLIQFYCLSDQQGRALAILPMWQKKLKLVSVFNVNWLTSLTNYYSPCFHFSINSELINKESAINSLLAQLAADKINWHALDFFPLKKETLVSISNGAKVNGLSYFPYWMTKNYYQNIEGDFNQYISGLSSRVTNTIKRKKRSLTKKYEWNIQIVKDFENINQYIHDYHTIYDNSWKKHEPYPNFISELIRQSSMQGSLRLGILKIEDKPVATQLWLVDNAQAYIYKLAYDVRYKSYSPGSLLTLAMFEQVIDKDKVEKVDFLTGNDNFKQDWMTESQDLNGVQIINPRSLVGCYLLIRNHVSQLRKKIFS